MFNKKYWCLINYLVDGGVANGCNSLLRTVDNNFVFSRSPESVNPAKSSVHMNCRVALESFH